MTENNSEAAALAGATASDTQDAVVGASTQHSTSDSPTEATPVVPQGGITTELLFKIGHRQAERMTELELHTDAALAEVHEHLHLARQDAIDPAAREDVLDLQDQVRALNETVQGLAGIVRALAGVEVAA